MRKKSDRVKLDYSKTKEFFDNRSTKYNKENPYAVTMYQDKHPELVVHRNMAETQKLIPLLRTDKKTRILDVGCGIGRFADAIENEIEYYLGVDFAEGLIETANERKRDEHYHFEAITAGDVAMRCREGSLEKFNRVLMVGILVYFNDNDISDLLTNVLECLEDEAIICIREPIAIDTRLTLVQEYSEELEAEYNAIYRTRDELMEFFESTFLSEGFKITEEAFLFGDPQLNNRKETSQYYFIMERR